MKCCDVTAGSLRAEIKIQRKTRVADGQGGVTDTWNTIDTVRAKWEGIGGTERWNYSDNTFMRPASENRFQAIVRFRGDAYGAPYYSAEDRVLYRNRTYAVESVMDMEDAQRWLTLMLIEGTPS